MAYAPLKSLVVFVSIAFLSVSFFAVSASAATLSGTISYVNGDSVGANQIDVRLWNETEKGFRIHRTVRAAAGGAYTFSDVLPGRYKLDARMRPGFSGHYGDTWYDNADPNSNGVFASDADILDIGEGDTLTGLNISLPTTGGFHGVTPQANIWVRAEAIEDYRFHHNDLTKTSPASRYGEFSMRGLYSNFNYRLIFYDPQGRFETLIAGGPYGVNNNTDPYIGGFTFTSIGSDPNEPNNSPDTATSFDRANLPYENDDAIIFPRGADVDWYCIDVDEGDRLLARSQALFTVAGEVRRHPWIDPKLGFFSGDGSELLQSNDDDPNGNGYSSFIDTGILTAGSYCFVATTFGDQDFTGAGQQTAGRYTFSVEMGNRRPYLTVSHGGNPAPVAPERINVAEGEDLTLTIELGDPEGDVLDIEVIHTNINGDPVSGTLDGSGNSYTYTWSVSPTDAGFGPYEIRIIVDDGEFAVDSLHIAAVDAVNLPPTTPILLSPVDGVRVAVAEVPLTIENSTDPNLDVLTYEFEIHETEISGLPGTSGLINEDNSGETTWTTPELNENSTYFWRARAFDGVLANGHSPWSLWESFVVDATNDAPDVPQILKPSPDELVMTPTPRISSTIPDDPDGDPVTVIFEVNDFSEVVATSSPIAPDAGDTLEWTTEPALNFGTRYYVRAKAFDDRGGESDWSAIVPFTTGPDDSSPPPVFAGDFGAQCEAGFHTDSPPESLVLHNIDQSAGALQFELQILWGTRTLYEIIVPQSDGEETEIPVDSTVFDQPGEYRVRVRTVIDDVNSDWRECLTHFEPEEDTDDVDDTGGVTVTSEEGCGCAAAQGGAPEGLAYLALLLLFVFGGRLRRTSAAS